MCKSPQLLCRLKVTQKPKRQAHRLLVKAVCCICHADLVFVIAAVAFRVLLLADASADVRGF